MPELPEVETIRRGIIKDLKHQTIRNIIIREHRFRWPIPRNIQKLLINKTIIDIERRAKYLLFKTREGIMLIHLGMSGRLRLLTHDVSHEKHDHVDIIFSNQKILRFTDPRRFGSLLWIEGDPRCHFLLTNLGIEPLTKDCSGIFLWTQARGKTLPIKSFLMNHKIVVGLGNIYASEALFAAGIDPAKPANKVTRKQFDHLAAAIKQILKKAIHHGGTTFKDFADSQGNPGYFFHELHVYGRMGLPCKKCRKPLASMRINQRNTVFCQNCQR